MQNRWFKRKPDYWILSLGRLGVCFEINAPVHMIKCYLNNNLIATFDLNMALKEELKDH